MMNSTFLLDIVEFSSDCAKWKYIFGDKMFGFMVAFLRFLMSTYIFSHLKYIIVSGFRKTSLCKCFCWKIDILEYEYVKDKTNYLFHINKLLCQIKFYQYFSKQNNYSASTTVTSFLCARPILIKSARWNRRWGLYEFNHRKWSSYSKASIIFCLIPDNRTDLRFLLLL